MADTVADFLVGIGVKFDASALAKANAAITQTEKSITAAQAAEIEKRIATEVKGSGKRVTLAQGLARLIEGMEQDRADKVDAIQKEQSQRAAKRDEEDVKKAVSRRDALLKSTRTLTVGMAGLVTGLAAGVTGAATGLLWATDRAAKHFERLAYAGQMSGSSATGISRVSYAVSQTGGNAEDAQQSVTAFGESLKKLPALEGILKSMGIATRESNGQLRDASALMVEYIDHLKELPQLQREARTGSWGISDTTTRAVLRDGYHSYENEYDKIQGTVGANPNAAGQGAIGFEQAMRRGFEIIGAVKTRVETSLFDIIKPRLDDISKWVLDHGDAISNVVTQISKGLTDLATAFVKSDVVQNAITGLGDGLERFAKYVASDAFKRDVHGFVDDVKALANAIRWALEAIGVLPSRSGSASVPTPEGTAGGDAGGGIGASLRNRRGSHRNDTNFDAVHGKQTGFGGGDKTHVEPSGKLGNLANNPNATAENAEAIRSAAKELGTTPEDLATVIGYETGGTFSPSKWGGAERQGSVYRKGGVYQGLIQFGPNERKQYGANGDQTFPQQMEAVKRYLKDRGFKPGMGLMDLYSTINAGSPGHYGASDGNGTVRSHVANMQQNMAPTARAFLAKGASTDTVSSPTASPSAPKITDLDVMAARQRIVQGHEQPGDRALEAAYLKQQNAPTGDASHPYAERTLGRYIRVTKPLAAKGEMPYPNGHVPLDAAHQKLAVAMDAAGKGIGLNAFKTHPLGVPPSFSNSIDNSRSRGDLTINHSPTYNVQGGDAKQNMDHARMSADRGTKDLVRNLKAVEQ